VTPLITGAGAFTKLGSELSIPSLMKDGGTGNAGWGVGAGLRCWGLQGEEGCGLREGWFCLARALLQIALLFLMLFVAVGELMRWVTRLLLLPQVVRKLGQGGMGQVYVVESPNRSQGSLVLKSVLCGSVSSANEALKEASVRIPALAPHHEGQVAQRQHRFIR
jgi:hypothetical protein